MERADLEQGILEVRRMRLSWKWGIGFVLWHWKLRMDVNEKSVRELVEYANYGGISLGGESVIR